MAPPSIPAGRTSADC